MMSAVEDMNIKLERKSQNMFNIKYIYPNL